MRVVLDTYIFVSMVLGGVIADINSGWKTGKFSLVVSDEIIAEYHDVIKRPKLHLAPRTITALFNRVYRKAKFVTITEKVNVINADPTDDKFLEAALAGRVDYIVSGDKHLLTLSEFRNIPILTGREFLDRLEITE